MKDQNKAHALASKIATAGKAMQQKRYADARTKYDRLIADPDLATLSKELQAECYLNRGFVLREFGRYQDALKDCLEAARLLPESYKPYLNTAIILANDLHQYARALNEFDKALERNPTDVVALCSRGLSKMLLGDLEGAEDDYQAALALSPHDLDVLLNLGNLYAQRQQFEKAAKQFQTILQHNPHDQEAKANLELAHYYIKNPAAAWQMRQDVRPHIPSQQERTISVPGEVLLLLVVFSVIAYAFALSGIASFILDSVRTIIIGAGVGAGLGLLAGLYLCINVSRKPLESWGPVSHPNWPNPNKSMAQMEMQFTGASLGALLGLIGTWILTQQIGPAQWFVHLFGAISGFAVGGFSTELALRRFARTMLDTPSVRRRAMSERQVFHKIQTIQDKISDRAIVYTAGDMHYYSKKAHKILEECNFEDKAPDDYANFVDVALEILTHPSIEATYLVLSFADYQMRLGYNPYGKIMMAMALLNRYYNPADDVLLQKAGEVVAYSFFTKEYGDAQGFRQVYNNIISSLDIIMINFINQGLNHIDQDIAYFIIGD